MSFFEQRIESLVEGLKYIIFKCTIPEIKCLANAPKHESSKGNSRQYSVCSSIDFLLFKPKIYHTVNISFLNEIYHNKY